MINKILIPILVLSGLGQTWFFFAEIAKIFSNDTYWHLLPAAIHAGLAWMMYTSFKGSMKTVQSLREDYMKLQLIRMCHEIAMVDLEEKRKP